MNSSIGRHSSELAPETNGKANTTYNKKERLLLVLGPKLRASHMLGKCCTPAHHVIGSPCNPLDRAREEPEGRSKS